MTIIAIKKTVIALLYDFDKTLCTKDMQEYTFIPGVGMEPKEFWAEAAMMKRKHNMDTINAYMKLMLDKAKQAGKSVNRQDFVNLGKDVEFYPGVTSWFERINKFGQNMGVEIQHYIISSGLREIIEGCSIYSEFKRVYASEFYYDENDVACWTKLAVNYTGKTQFLFRVNKGALDIWDDQLLNEYVPEDKRIVPFRNMIYFGDGMTDVPCMKLVRQNGGYSIAVHKPGQIELGEKLLAEERVNFSSEADYSKGKDLELLVAQIVTKMFIDDQLHQLSSQEYRDSKHKREVRSLMDFLNSNGARNMIFGIRKK